MICIKFIILFSDYSRKQCYKSKTALYQKCIHENVPIYNQGEENLKGSLRATKDHGKSNKSWSNQVNGNI